MRKILVRLLLLVFTVGVLQADTIYLRDGSVIKGILVGFENGEFILETRRGKQETFLSRYVSRVVMDRYDINLAAPKSGPRSQWEKSVKTIEVAARQAWTDSGIDLQPGMQVKISPEGRIRIGERSAEPEGIPGDKNKASRYPMPGENLGAVIAKIRNSDGRDSDLFFIGAGREMKIAGDEAGRLFIGVNDDYLADNKGEYRVNISVARSTGSRTPNPFRLKIREKAVEVAAEQAWTDTGIDLEPGAWIEVTAGGRIRIGERSAEPEGIPGNGGNTSRYPMPGENLGAVIAKIKYPSGQDSDFIFIGSQKQTSIETDEAGRLFIGINDDYLPDNKGEYSVKIRWQQD